MKSNTLYFGIVVFFICFLLYSANLFAEVKLIASDAQAGDNFGWSVAMAGNVAVVGAHEEDSGGAISGAAYVFERNEGGTNTWGEVKKLMASDAKEFSEFGEAVAVAGDVIIVGAYAEDSLGGNAGAAYIFERNAGGTKAWGEVKKLTASDAQADDRFGYSVAIAGDVVIIGARGEDTGGNNAGAAYIFERNAGGNNAWGEMKKLTSSDAEGGNEFGWAVAVAGDVAIVGTYLNGTAYIFERNAGGANNWGQLKILTASDAEVGDSFGYSVAVAGDMAIVGAYGEDTGGTNSGAVYIFERNAGGANAWGEVKKITASDAKAYDLFGISVAIAGDVAIVGAYGKNTGGHHAGAAYVFSRNAGGSNAWGEVKKLIASDAQPTDRFGISVAVAGDVSIVGAHSKKFVGYNNVGAAYVIPVGIPIDALEKKIKRKKKTIFKWKTILPEPLGQYLTNNYGIGIYNIDGPNKLTTKNNKVWKYKSADKNIQIIYKEKFNKKKGVYKTILIYKLKDKTVPEDFNVYISTN